MSLQKKFKSTPNLSQEPSLEPALPALKPLLQTKNKTNVPATEQEEDQINVPFQEKAKLRSREILEEQEAETNSNRIVVKEKEKEKEKGGKGGRLQPNDLKRSSGIPVGHRKKDKEKYKKNLLENKKQKVELGSDAYNNLKFSTSSFQNVLTNAFQPSTPGLEGLCNFSIENANYIPRTITAANASASIKISTEADNTSKYVSGNSGKNKGRNSDQEQMQKQNQKQAGSAIKESNAKIDIARPESPSTKVIKFDESLFTMKNMKTSQLQKHKYISLKDIDNITQSYSKIYSLSQSNFDIAEYLADDEKIHNHDEGSDEDGGTVARGDGKKGWFGLRIFRSNKSSNYGTHKYSNQFRNPKGDVEMNREKRRDGDGDGDRNRERGGGRNRNQTHGGWRERRVCYMRPQVFVCVVFVAALLLGVAAFFFWPRVPTVIATDIFPSGPAKTLFDAKNNVYGLSINARVQYTAVSGSFYKRTIKSLSMQSYSTVSGEHISSGKAENIVLGSMETKTFYIDTEISFYADAPNDNTVYTLLKSCAPINSTIEMPSKYARRSDNLLLNVKTKVIMDGLKFSGPQSVSNVLGLLCPK